MSTDKELDGIVDEVDVDPNGLSIVLGVPAQDIRDWMAQRKTPPKWFVAYMSMILCLQRVGRLTYGEVGNPYE